MNKPSLIRAINNGDQINEIFSFLKKPEAKKPAEKPAKDEDESDEISTNIPLMHQFVDSIKDAPSGKNRYILRMTTSDLKLHYLKSGVGGKSFIESLDPKILANFGMLQSRVELMFPNYDVKKLISKNPKYDAIVLLDVPTSFTSDLKTAWSGAEDINAVKDTLMKMMNHRYYVMTLSSSRLSKIISKIEPKWHDSDALVKVFDPSVVLSYPNTSEFASIANEYAEIGNGSSSNDEQEERQDTSDDNGDDDKPTMQQDALPPKPAIAKDVKRSDMSPQQRANRARLDLGSLKNELAGKGVPQSTIDTITKALSDME